MSFMVYKVVWKVPRAPTPWESNALCKYMNKSPIRQPQFSEHFSLHIQTRCTKFIHVLSAAVPQQQSQGRRGRPFNSGSVLTRHSSCTSASGSGHGKHRLHRQENNGSAEGFQQLALTTCTTLSCFCALRISHSMPGEHMHVLSRLTTVYSCRWRSETYNHSKVEQM